MDISYITPYFFLHSYTLALRHLEVAFSDNQKSTVQKLWNRGVVAHVDESGAVSLLGRVKHILLAFTECIPAIGAVIAFIDRLWNGRESLPPYMPDKCKAVVGQTPKFAGYTFKGNRGVRLTDLTVRPANLLYREIFGIDPSTQPGSSNRFEFPRGTSFSSWVPRTYHVTAKGKTAFEYSSRTRKPIELDKCLGNKTFAISSGEISSMQNSQEIWVSPLIPKKFYLAMKEAFNRDGIVILPGHDIYCPTLAEIMETEQQDPPFMGVSRSTSLFHFRKFLLQAEANPQAFGFGKEPTTTPRTSADLVRNMPFKALKDLTLYQLGSMIVKKEDYRPLVTDGYEIAERKVGDPDEIRLISAAGIRGFHGTTKMKGNDRHQVDREIMTETFKTSLKAAGKGSDIVFPAVRMGVWGGDPDIYWRAFLDAVVKSGDEIEWIYVNPRHQDTRAGKWRGYRGQEFAELLAQYQQTHPDCKNLGKVINLYRHQTDLLLLAQKLKKAQPEKTIALFNACNPDVTLGGHVGEYINNLDHTSTTEENFAAAGTSGMGFEHITKVLDDPNKIHQG